MKNLSVFLCAMVLVFGVVGIKNTAHADNWFLSPSGPVDTSGNSLGEIITIDLNFNYTGDMSAYFTAIDLDFSVDLTEVTFSFGWNQSSDVVFWNIGSGFSPIASQLVGNTLSIAGGNLSGYNQWTVGNNNVATIRLMLIDTDGPWDGGDVDLVTQTGFKGVADYYGSVVNFGGADGPDYGAVPIPSAIWLLGSAFIGLVGFRKKFMKG